MPFWRAAVLGYLIVARVTRFLNSDYLAADFRMWVKVRFGDGKIYYLVTCPWCASIWVALPIAVYIAATEAKGAHGKLLEAGGLWAGFSYVHGIVTSQLDD